MTTKMTDFRVVVRGEYLAAAALFRSSEVTRYYLHGVAVEQRSDEGLTLIATDGHHAVMIRDIMAFGRWDMSTVEGEMLPLSTPPNLLKAASKRSKRQCSTWVVYSPKPTPIYVVDASCAEEALAVVDNQNTDAVLHMEAGAPLIDCRYPDIRRVFPAKVEARQGDIAPFGFNPELMANYGRAYRLLSGGRGGEGYVAVTMPVDSGPMWVKTPSEVMIGWLMPMRWAGKTGPDADLAQIYAEAIDQVIGHPMPYSPQVIEDAEEAAIAAE